LSDALLKGTACGSDGSSGFSTAGNTERLGTVRGNERLPSPSAQLDKPADGFGAAEVICDRPGFNLGNQLIGHARRYVRVPPGNRAAARFFRCTTPHTARLRRGQGWV